jgi:methylmalonyl-CoA mutase cobalamin-binding domain/chain
MRTAFDGIPLDQVSTSMTINAPAACLLLLYELVGEEQACPPSSRAAPPRTTCSRSTSRAATTSTPVPTMRLTTDLFQYCHERVPKWNTISISGYHFREKGCSAVQEVAFTLCSGIAYVRAAIDKGLNVDEFAPGWRSSSTATTTSSRRSPSSRRAAHVGAHHAETLRRDQPEGPDAALPHPDRRRDPDRPAA